MSAVDEPRARGRAALLAEGAALLLLAGGALVVGLVIAPEWFDQAQLPKRVAFGLIGPAALAAAALAVLLDPGRFSWGRGGRVLLVLFAAQILWAGFIAPFAISPSAARDALIAAAGGACWFAAGLVLFSRSPARRVLSGIAVLVALVAALVGLAQHAAANPGRFPFVGEAGAALEAVLLGGIETFGLAALRQAAVPASLYGHANFGGELLAALGPFLAGLALVGLRRAPRGGLALGRRLGGLAAASALAVGGLYVARSSSRAALLALLAGLGLLALHVIVERGRRRPLFGSTALHLAAFALLAVALAGGFWAAARSTDFQPRHGQTRTSLARRLASGFDPRNTTVRERLDLWGNGLAIVEDRPVFGVGPGGFGRAYPAWADARRRHVAGRLTLRRQPAHAHNELVEIAVERGWTGLALALGALTAIVAIAFARLRSAGRGASPDGGALAAGLAGSLLALGLVALASFPLHHAPTALVGLLAAAALAARAPFGPARRPIPRSVAAFLLVVGLATGALALPRLGAAGAASRDLAFSVIERAEPAGAETAAEDRLAVDRTRGLAALRHLDAALARRPDDHLLTLARAEALRRFGRPREARVAYERTLELHPYLVNAWLGLAELELQGGRIEAARRAARRALDLKDDAPAAHLALARVDAASGFEGRAWRGFRTALALDPIGPERLAVLVELVASAARRGDARIAAFFLDRARILAPDHPAVNLAAARAAQRFAPGSPQSRRAWEAVVAGGNENFEALLQLGIARQAAGDAAGALAALDRARRLAPRDAALLFHRARALIALGRLPEANAELLACAAATGRPGGDLVLFERSVRLAHSLRDELLAGKKEEPR